MPTVPGFVNVTDYGAVGDGSTDDTAAIQAAISAVSTAGGGCVLIPPGTYMVCAVTYYNDDGTVYGATSLKIFDNIHLAGSGAASIIRLFPNQYGPGAFYRMISSRNSVRLSNAKISDLTLDGNASNQIASTQCSNILLEVQSNVAIEGVHSINANGQGIQMRGTTSNAGTDLAVRNCVVTSASFIGIQCSQFSRLNISNNLVSGTANNCIDIYGQGDSTTVSNGNHFSITGNVVTGDGGGIFVETSSKGVVSGNEIQECAIGVAVNRIDSPPEAVGIVGNTIDGCATGIQVTGDMLGVSIYSNHVNNFTSVGVQLGGGGGNVSYVDVSNNFFTPATNTTHIIQISGYLASFITGKFNTVNSHEITASYLFASSATTTYVCAVDSFKVLPYQVGFDLFSANPQFTLTTILTGTENNVSGSISIPINTLSAGTVTVTAYQSGIGHGVYIVPFIKDDYTLVLGTPQVVFVTANPISGVSSVSNNLSVSLAAANSSVKWAIQYVPTP